jgi:F0F1-type ATP synthase delta subunit
MELVRNYATALGQTSEDNSTFDRIISEMRANKKVRAQEMREIAKVYLGYEIAKTKGRADALKAIVERQALTARQDARGRTLDRLKSW